MEVAGDRLRADHPNHVWALDFAFDQTSDCRTLKGRDAGVGDSFGLGSGCCLGGDLVFVLDGGQSAE